MNETEAFGRRALALSDAPSLLALEVAEGREAIFLDIDALLGQVLARALRGQPVVAVERGRHKDVVTLESLDAGLQKTLDDIFAVPNQHSRGAWFLPEKVSLKSGLANLPFRFATGASWEDRARAVLAESPAAVFLWAVLEPLVEQLFLPFDLRGRLSGTKSADEKIAAWSLAAEILSALGLEVQRELGVMRCEGGWSRLQADQQWWAKQHLLTALASQASEKLGANYRAYRLQALIARYYKTARSGRAKRQQVLTRPLERTLAGFFGGDWLRFVSYLGEEPHPDEEIATAISETRLFVGGSKSAATVASELGLPAEEVARAQSIFWDTSSQQVAGAMSPVGERTGVLKAFWEHFDVIHSRQASGMLSLLGLVVAAGQGVTVGPQRRADWYDPGLYRKLLPDELLRRIEVLWGSIMLPRWPEHIVSEISPHALMAEAFGPALQFWDGVAGTAWFVCDLPGSQGSMAGLEVYYHDALSELARMNCPINPALLSELKEAEEHLGPPTLVEGKVSSMEVRPGVSIEIRRNVGFRRSGFERLRDIITNHRRRWVDQHLETYLRTRWEGEIREADRIHSQWMADQGSPPTPNQFAAAAARPTNHWFGGDLSLLLAAIGEKSTIRCVRSSLMPPERQRFAETVFARLGGRQFEREFARSLEERTQDDAQSKLGWLAEKSLQFIQLEEALGRPPELREFGVRGFEYRITVLSANLSEAWERYTAVVESARTGFSVPASLASQTAAAGRPQDAEPSAPVRADTSSNRSTPERRPWFRRLLGR